MKQECTSIDDYIRLFPADVRRKLAELRAIVSEEAPQAEETISYQMPTFYMNGNLVHFAAHSGHIGFYPTPSGIAAFKSQIAKYKHAKGSVQFPLSEPLPAGLIRQIVRFRVKENLKKKR